MRRLKALSDSRSVYTDPSHYHVSSSGHRETSYLCQYDSSSVPLCDQHSPAPTNPLYRYAHICAAGAGSTGPPPSPAVIYAAAAGGSRGGGCEQQLLHPGWWCVELYIPCCGNTLHPRIQALGLSILPSLAPSHHKWRTSCNQKSLYSAPTEHKTTPPQWS